VGTTAAVTCISGEAGPFHDGEEGHENRDGVRVMAKGSSPVLEALVEINEVSLARTELDLRSLMLVRIAALVAVDAPTSSYLLHVGPSVDAGLTARDAEDVLVAVAPIVGAPKAASAATKIAEALDLAISFAIEDSQ
jgi:alkylhydroperoxidase/carboxymuconolactone decarboxylase family protein YurZ